MHPHHPISFATQRTVQAALCAGVVLLLLATWAAPAETRAAATPAASGTGNAQLVLPLAGAPQGVLEGVFARAGAEFNVPPTLLEAIGYVESHWDGRAGQPNDYAQYGIMGLAVPPGGDSLVRAAALVGLPPATLQTNDSANIRGAAALLRSLAAETPAATAATLTPWYTVVAGYSGFADPLLARSYAYSVFTVLQEGVEATTADGETLRIAPSGKMTLPDAADPLQNAPATDDYPPAHWVPANANNFQLGRPYGPVNFIVIHDTEGTYQAAINWFQNASSGVSAHFVTRSRDGDITQMVHAADTAYHAGNWDYNVRAVGVEHEGYMSQQGWYTAAMYDASAALVRAMADRFGVHKDHAHIIGHYQVPNQPSPAHVDPGPNWDWAGYLARVRNDAAVVARVRNTDAGFAASPGIIDPAHGWSIYNGGWNGGQAYRALSTSGAPSNTATWSTALPAAGLYDVYAYIPWVDNGRAETQNAHYTVATTSGAVQVTLDQHALTTAGILQGGLAPEGEWGHLGRFALPSWSTVSLNNATGDDALNVWFDTLMWIPAGSVASPTPQPPPTDTPVATGTPAWTPTRTPTRIPTWTPVVTPTAPPTETATPLPTATATPEWTPGPCGMRFSDLPDTHWAYSYVAYLYCHGIISGYADGTFQAGANANRGQLAKMLALGLGWSLPTPATPTFSDVPAMSPYFYYIENAYAHGVVSGYADGTFRPFNSITRAQLSKMIAVAEGWAPIQPNPPSFTDVPSTYWAFGFVEAVHARGVVAGYADGTFQPANEATRGQLSKMLSTAFQVPADGTPVPTGTTTPAPLFTGTATPAGTGTPTSTVTSTRLPTTGTPTPVVTGSPTLAPTATGTGTPVAATGTPATATATPTLPATSTLLPSPSPTASTTPTAHP